MISTARVLYSFWPIWPASWAVWFVPIYDIVLENPRYFSAGLGYAIYHWCYTPIHKKAEKWLCVEPYIVVSMVEQSCELFYRHKGELYVGLVMHAFMCEWAPPIDKLWRSKLSIPRVVTNMSLARLGERLWTKADMDWFEIHWWLGCYLQWVWI